MKGNDEEDTWCQCWDLSQRLNDWLQKTSHNPYAKLEVVQYEQNVGVEPMYQVGQDQNQWVNLEKEQKVEETTKQWGKEQKVKEKQEVDHEVVQQESNELMSKFLKLMKKENHLHKI